jgi:hypothetical protein
MTTITDNDNPNPSWYKGGCIICGAVAKGSGWEIVNADRFMWKGGGEELLHKPELQPYLVIHATDGDDELLKGFPFCAPCFNKFPGSQARIDAAVKVISRYINPNGYNECSKCGFEYPYGGPELCQSCKLWKVVGG